MLGKRVAAFIGILLCLGQIQAQAGQQAGLDWLQSQLATDGHFENQKGLATDFQAAGVALEALHDSGGSAALDSILRYLDTENYASTASLARRITARQLLHQDASGLIAILAARQNSDGGFGELPGYQSTSIDTSNALRALGAADQDVAYRAMQFLLGQQASDGSWTDWQGDNTAAYSTARVIEALAPWRDQLSAVGSASRSAVTWLSSVRHGDGGWGESFVTAQTLIGLVAASAEPALGSSVADHLLEIQAADGSWNEDVFTTALAVRALRAAEQSATPTRPAGTAAGYVVEAETAKPIADAKVFVASDPGHVTTTNTDGYYRLTNLPTGQFTIVAGAPGYDPSSTIVAVDAGATAKISRLVLAPAGKAALVYGRVSAQESGAPLPGATVMLNGSAQYRAVATDDGSFAIGVVSPGEYTLTVSADGYISASGSVAFSAGEQYRIDQSLLLTGTYPSDKPIDVTATVVDANTGAPIANATLTLNSLLFASSDDSGTIAIPDVPAATYQATVSAPGYVSSLYTVVLVPGGNGDFGRLKLYPATGEPAPDTLTLLGTVVSGLGGEPVVDATITRTDTGATWTSDADGRFTISDIDTLNFTLQITAADYKTRQFAVSASGYGSVSGSFPLPPAGGNPAATAVTLSGHIKDASTGTPVADAKVTIAESELSAKSDNSGAYWFAAIPDLEFNLQVAAVGYQTQSFPVTVSQYGNYTLDIRLAAEATGSALHILSVDTDVSEIAATDSAVFVATAGNSSDSGVEATLFAEITNSKGGVIAAVSGRKPGATEPSGAFTIPPAGQTQVEFTWRPKQLTPGPYTVTVYAVDPGTGSRSNPHGTVLATGATMVTVIPTEAIAGQLAFDPPLVQAGTDSPVSLSALVVNDGNITLEAQRLSMKIIDPASGDVIYSANGEMAALPVNNNTNVTFGSWIPTATGNLEVRVTPIGSGVSGEINGQLYVGNKATGQFSVDQNIVAPGDKIVHATVAMHGVDLSQGTSTDPMFFAVRRAVTNGAAYVGVNAKRWQNRHRCLGCHIQSQSLLGLSSSVGKAPIDPNAIKYLATAIATGGRDNGSYQAGRPYEAQTQTLLSLWSLTQYQDGGTLFRSKLAAAMYLHKRRRSSGSQTYWYPDEWGAWWSSTDRNTALAIAGMADVLNAADSVNVANIRSRLWREFPYAGTITSGRSVKVGPDGRIYVLRENGTIDWIDPENRTNGTAMTVALPGNAYGLAVVSANDFYVSGTGYVVHVKVGEEPAVVWSGYGDVTDVALTSAGKLYGVNQDTSQLICFCNGKISEVLDGRTLNHPVGLAIDSFDSIMVADSGDYSLVKLSADGAVRRWAEGLSQQPHRIVSDGLGGWYVRSRSASPEGRYEPPSIYHFTSEGLGQSIANASALAGIAMFNGSLIAIDRGNRDTVLELDGQSVDVASELTVLRQDVAGGARYLLGRYRDSNSQLITQALRLWGLAEARKVVTDSALQSQLDDAVAYLDNKLRSSQNGNGGWGRYPWYGSDALVTAIVGLALNYSHPSAQDEATRSAIQYLLNTQAGDGSWYSANRIMATRLSTTSLVMDYMPEALDLLGGLDVDLFVADTPKVSLAGFEPSPDDISIGGDARSTYHWHLTGVRSSGRDVQFNIGLPAMLANEERAVAGSALLQFHNSFDESTVSVDLAVPHVKAISGLGITVRTDSTQYRANTPVNISGVVGNNGVAITNGKIRIRISAPDGALVSTFTAVSDLQLASAGQSAYSASWNTATYVPGPYEVTAVVIDDSGTVADTATTVFQILASGSDGDSAASLRTTTDKVAYNTTDTVNISDLVQNLTANAELSLVHLHLDVVGPNGNIVQIFDHDLEQLAPGGQRKVYDTSTLDHAAEGDYRVVGQLTDATGSTLAADQATFSVSDQLGRTLIGHVSVQSANVYQGDTQICTDSLLNNGVGSLVDQPIKQVLVDLHHSSVVASVTSAIHLDPDQRTRRQRDIDTGGLAVGDYACVLQAKINGHWNSLDHAVFHVALPPIIIESLFSQSGRGRLLVLLDAPATNAKGKIIDDRDPHGPPFTPGLAEQRQWLEQFLTDEGWSYTIVTSADAFEREFNTHGYALYALFSEQIKLPEALQHRLVDEVEHGVGLLVAGNHDRRNGRIEEALGIKSQGVAPHATAINVQPFGTFAGGTQQFTLDNKPLKIRIEGASVLGTYRDSGRAPSPAVTFYTPVEGRGMFVGFDLLQQALAERNGEFLRTLLANALLYSHSASLTPYTGAVLPFQVTLVNEGRGTPGRVTLELPKGAVVVDAGNGRVDTKGRPIWMFTLGKRQTLTWRLWIKLPTDAGPAAFKAAIETGNAPDYKSYGQAQLQVQIVGRP